MGGGGGGGGGRRGEEGGGEGRERGVVVPKRADYYKDYKIFWDLLGSLYLLKLPHAYVSR